jgi:hypothetical protein
MQRMTKRLGFCAAALLALAALPATARAQVYVQAAPPCPVPVVSYYAAPAVSYYAAPVYAAPAYTPPAVSFYSPAPVYTQPTQYTFYGPTPAYAAYPTYYQPVIGNRVVTSYYTPAYTYRPGYYSAYYTPLYYRY